LQSFVAEKKRDLAEYSEWYNQTKLQFFYRSYAVAAAIGKAAGEQLPFIEQRISMLEKKLQDGR
jgi:hypothetical protein